MVITIISNVLLIGGLWFVCVIALLWVRYAADLKRLWLEPMLNYPVVILESDDWGVGPMEQQEVLEEIIDLLSDYCDSDGQHPVMTLGLILAEPDVDKIKETQGKNYFRRTLTSKRYKTLLNTIQKGVDNGVFSVQLHGLEHFWPASVMKCIDKQPKVERWLFENSLPISESLPSELQSRWLDCSALPCNTHQPEEINAAIDDELKLYEKIFGQLPGVVVPPTFVWTEKVEQAYANRHIKTLVTPGKQFTGRDIEGNLLTNNRYFYNGQISQDGLLYLVRDDYFEPGLGHKALNLLARIKDKANCGRPSLLEIHRFNFIKNTQDKTNSLSELNSLLQLVTKHFSNVRYMSSEQLADILRIHHHEEQSNFIINSFVKRVKIWLARVKLFFQYNRLAKYSGFNALLRLSWIKTTST